MVNYLGYVKCTNAGLSAPHWLRIVITEHELAARCAVVSL